MSIAVRRIADQILVARGMRRAAEVAELDLVAAFADAYPAPASLAAEQQVIQIGADGTPPVAAFATEELAALLGCSGPTTAGLIATALNLRHRHPQLWGAIHDGRVEIWQARFVARRCADTGLDRAAAGWVDEQLRHVWGRVAWARLKRRLEGLILRADTALAERRAEQARTARFVHIRHHGDGTSLLIAQLDTGDAVRLDRALDSLAMAAIHDGTDGSLAELRSAALGELALPADTGADVTPSGGMLPRHTSTLVIHLDRASLSTDGAARCDDLGPLLLDQVTDLLAHDRVKVLPVLDLAGDPSVDAYEIPDRIRRQLTMTEPFSIFPFSTRQSATADLDHTEPYQPTGPPGQTRPSNLGPLGRPCSSGQNLRRLDRRPDRTGQLPVGIAAGVPLPSRVRLHRLRPSYQRPLPAAGWGAGLRPRLIGLSNGSLQIGVTGPHGV